MANFQQLGTLSRVVFTMLAAVALIGLSSCGDDDDGGGNNGGGMCADVSCPQPVDQCDGDTAITYSGAGACDNNTGSCVYGAVEETTDCTTNGQVCEDGACVDDNPCQGQTCDAPVDSCDGNVAVQYSGAGVCQDNGDCDFSSVETRTDCSTKGKACKQGACVEDSDVCKPGDCEQLDDVCDGDTLLTYSGAGSCDENSGMCDYSSVEQQTNCTDNGQICKAGKCVDESTDMCDGVTCPQPEPTCDGDTAVAYSGDGMCDAADGMCDFSDVETRTDCTASGKVCDSGMCVDDSMDMCAGVSCSQPSDSCDGDTAVTYSGDGMCDPADGSCDFSGVETRTDCTSSGKVCQSGSCVAQADHSVNAGDLVITEIMQNPDNVNDSDGEYFEVYNVTNRTLYLNGLVFKDLGSDSETVSDPNSNNIELSPTSYFVFGTSGDTAVNGGVTVDYVYSSTSLANGGDEIILETSSGTEIDRVVWGGSTSFPDPTGASMQFGGQNDLQNDDNNFGGAWCESTDPIDPNNAMSDLGTPGTANTQCAP